MAMELRREKVRNGIYIATFKGIKVVDGTIFTER